MRAGTWLALGDLRGRAGRALLAASLVAVAAALGSGLELVARAREEAAARRIDGVGPALRIVPSGVGGSALARLDLGQAFLPDAVLEQVAAALGPELREARARLVIQRLVAGRWVPVIGQGGGPPAGVALGPALAEATGHPADLDLGAGTWPVRRVQEVTGAAEDGAAFVSLQAAQGLAGREAVNEIQIYLRAGSTPGAAAARLEAAGLQAMVVASGRGTPADQEVQGALAKGRRLAQVVLAVLVVLGLAVVAHLDAAERRVEVATLRAIGAGTVTVWWTLVARSVVVGTAGGTAGSLAGAALAAAQDPASAAGLSAACSTAGLVMALCAVVGALSASPTALATAWRDPVPWLQEG